MSDGLLAIGAFSRSCSISVKTLRTYHELGLLVPARVDPATGYRSYTVDQLADAGVIARLRSLELPLPQVKAVLDGRDPELTRRILAEHRLAMEDRLAETERIVAELQHGLAPVTHTPVHLRDVEARHTVRQAGVVPVAELWDWVFATGSRLLAAIEAAGTRALGPVSAFYPAELADEEVEEVEVFVAVDEPFLLPAGSGGLSLGQAPAATLAVLVHRGDGETIGESYRQLGAWVGRRAESTGAPVREHYVVGPLETDRRGDHVTEIGWPIRPGSVV